MQEHSSKSTYIHNNLADIPAVLLLCRTPPPRSHSRAPPSTRVPRGSRTRIRRRAPRTHGAPRPGAAPATTTRPGRTRRAAPCTSAPSTRRAPCACASGSAPCTRRWSFVAVGLTCVLEHVGFGGFGLETEDEVCELRLELLQALWRKSRIIIPPRGFTRGEPECEARRRRTDTQEIEPNAPFE